MFSTDQYRVFSGEHVDRVLSRPRRLLHEGRIADADAAYREVLLSQPDLKQAWIEYFDLLRHSRRFSDARVLAARAEERFSGEALGPALSGAALVELGHYREGLAALEEASRRDPDMGMVWHEAGYAAYRLGELSRALMALDRAFALQPRSGTLHLRGKVLRQAGHYLAAEVSFEGAAEAAEFAEQRWEAERQISVTRRYAAFPGSRPDRIAPPRRWFADTGAVPLTGLGAAPQPTDETMVDGLAQLAVEEGWRFTAVVPADAWSGWSRLAAVLNIPVDPAGDRSTDGVPLVVVRTPNRDVADWGERLHRVAAGRRGLTFAMHQPLDVPSADVIGLLDGPESAVLDPAFAAEAVQHPEGRLRGRVLR
jgi:tetratricopeptide (TPR) repeat protein